MKTATTVLLTVSFASVAVLGFFAMGHGITSGHVGCLGAAAQGVPCPESGRTLNYIDFHFFAFKKFSTAIFDHNVSALVLLLAALAAIGYGLFRERVATSPSPFGASVLASAEQLSCPPAFRFLGWLSRHEMSPTCV